jgi:hypothetical protein
VGPGNGAGQRCVEFRCKGFAFADRNQVDVLAQPAIG